MGTPPSQLAPLTLFNEKNTGTNLPAQIELYATPGEAYKFLFVAKGGGSANKTFLFQETKALLTRFDELSAKMGEDLDADAMQKVQTDRSDKPLTDVVINSVTITEHD